MPLRCPCCGGDRVRSKDRYERRVRDLACFVNPSELVFPEMDICSFTFIQQIKPNKMTYEKTIAKLKRQIASLETKASRSAARTAKTHRRRFITLAKKLGYKTVHLAYAGLFAAGEKLDEVLGTTDASPTKTRKRAKITDAKRKAVIVALKSGEVAAKIAKKVGISLPSVNNIKKAAGLTKSKKTVKKVATRKTAPKAAKPTKKVKKRGPRRSVKVKIPESSMDPVSTVTPSSP